MLRFSAAFPPLAPCIHYCTIPFMLFLPPLCARGYLAHPTACVPCAAMPAVAFPPTPLAVAAASCITTSYTTCAAQRAVVRTRTRCRLLRTHVRTLTHTHAADTFCTPAVMPPPANLLYPRTKRCLLRAAVLCGTYKRCAWCVSVWCAALLPFPCTAPLPALAVRSPPCAARTAALRWC